MSNTPYTVITEDSIELQKKISKHFCNEGLERTTELISFASNEEGVKSFNNVLWDDVFIEFPNGKSHLVIHAECVTRSTYYIKDFSVISIKEKTREFMTKSEFDERYVITLEEEKIIRGSTPYKILGMCITQEECKKQLQYSNVVFWDN